MTSIQTETPLHPGDTRPRANRRPDIQGLRAVAVLFVVCFHAGLPVHGGFVGVDVFFVISGYVITSLLRREDVGRRTPFRSFYARRFRRLTPALAVTVSVTAVISGLVMSPLLGQENAAKTGIGAMLLGANFVIANTTGGYFDAAASTNPLLNTWSLSVEEQFYLFFPLALVIGGAFAHRFMRGRFGAGLVALGVTVVSFALAVVSSHGYHAPHSLFVGFYSPFTRAWEFGVGALLAIEGGRIAGRLARASTVFGLAGAVMLAVSLRAISGSTPFPGLATLLPVTGTLLLLFAGLGSRNVVSRALATRPMVAIGDISYSWYLWHWPLIVFAAFLWPGSTPAKELAALVSLAPALVSYTWIEQPIRNLRNVSARRMAKIVVVTLAAPIALSLLLWVATNNGLWSNNVKDLQARIDPLHAAAVANCTIGQIPSAHGTDCRWNTGAHGRPIYLIGDSNADQFSEAVIGAGTRAGRPVTIDTFNGCALLGAYWSDETDAQQAQCRGWVGNVQSWLAAEPHGLVIIGFSDSLWVTPGIAVGPTRAAETAERKPKAAYLESELQALVANLEHAGHSVLIMQPLPKPWRVNGNTAKVLLDPTRCTGLGVLRGTCPKRIDTTRAYVDRMQADPRATVRRVAAQTRASVLDLQPYFCPHGLCSTERDGVLLYRDGGHITVDTSRALAGRFERAIRAADS